MRGQALNQAGWIALWQGDYHKAVALTEEGLALSEQLEDKPAVAYSLFLLGEAAALYGDHARLRTMREQAEALRPELDDRPATAYLLIGLGLAAQEEGDHEQVEALLGESLALHGELGDVRGAAICRSILGVAALERGDCERATLYEEEFLRWTRETKEKAGIVYGLMIMAGVAALQGDPARAARLWGAEEALREAISYPISAYDRTHYDREGYQAAARSRLDEAEWEAAWVQGRAMTPEEATEYALSKEVEEPTSSPKEGTAGLSERELEILRLVAQGMTDPLVANRLYLSPRTVGQHLRSIYRKLGVPSRAAAAREAAERGLI